MKTTILVLAALQIIGMQTAFAGARSEFETLSKQANKNSYEQQIVSAIREEGCDTNILDSERSDPQNTYLIWVSTKKCVCKVSILGALPVGASIDEAIYRASARCMKK